MAETKKALLDKAIADLAADLKEAVRKIDSDPLPTTKYNYGRYLNLISVVSNGDRKVATIIVAALLAAGANANGVAAAYKIIKG